MGGSGDSSTSSFGLTDTPVLLEGGSTLNGRFVGSGGSVHIVCASITDNCSFVSCTTGRVVGSKVFHNVEFNEGTSCPSVNGQISISRRTPGSRVSYAHRTSRVPSFSKNKVTRVSPLDTVTTACS